MTKPNGKMKIELDDRELEQLQNIHVATAIRETMRTPGWGHISEIITNMVERLENQHLNFAMSGNNIAARDAYWGSGLRLGGAREFAMILQQQIATKVGLLDQPLRPPAKDPDAMTGDAGAEGE